MTDSMLVIAVILVVTALAVITLGVGSLIRGWLLDFDADMDDHDRHITECINRIDALEERLRALETSEAIMRFEVMRREIDAKK